MKNIGLRYFVITSMLFFAVFGVVIFLSERGDTVFYINTLGSPTLDVFFKYFTDLGLGLVLAILAVIFLFIRYYYSILFTATLIGSGILKYIFKQLLFPGVMRPTGTFPIEDFYRVVEGVEFATKRSFPSGHTMTAFAMSAILAIYFKNKYAGIFLSIFAVLIGVSRMYLLQHFLLDITIGGLLGSVLAFALHYWLKRYQDKFSGKFNFKK